MLVVVETSLGVDAVAIVVIVRRWLREGEGRDELIFTGKIVKVEGN